jgi:hypothetical protein
MQPALTQLIGRHTCARLRAQQNRQAQLLGASSQEPCKPYPSYTIPVSLACMQITGIPGCVFVHAGGFIGGAATYESVLEMARKSLVMD